MSQRLWNFAYHKQLNSMQRRFFMQALLGMAAYSRATAASVSSLFAGLPVLRSGKRVDNARPVPPFTVEKFKDTPSVRFLIIGDWGAGGKFQRQVASRMLRKAEDEQCGFVISTGDNIYPKGVESATDGQWRTKFEQVYTGRALEIPWYAVLGNHDYRSNVDAQIEYGTVNPRWNMPARYYTFSKEIEPGVEVGFFALDTQRIMNGKARGEQKEWLEKALAASKARWKVVIGHHMVRSHGIYGDQDVMLRHIKPLLDSYNVDMYMCGHDHDLQYLKAPDDSFHCLLSGGGGGARDTAYGDNTLFAATNGGFAYAAISRTRFHIQFQDREGQVLFAHTLAKDS